MTERSEDVGCFNEFRRRLPGSMIDSSKKKSKKTKLALTENSAPTELSLRDRMSGQFQRRSSMPYESDVPFIGWGRRCEVSRDFAITSQGSLKQCDQTDELLLRTFQANQNRTAMGSSTVFMFAFFALIVGVQSCALQFKECGKFLRLCMMTLM